MSGNEAWNRNVFKRCRKVDRDGADITLSGRLFQMVGPATGKARPPTVDSFTVASLVGIRTLHAKSGPDPLNAVAGHTEHTHGMALVTRASASRLDWLRRN